MCGRFGHVDDRRLTVGRLERLRHDIYGGRRFGIQAAQAAHGQPQHVELQHHFRVAVVDNATISQYGQAICAALAFFAGMADKIVNMLIRVGNIELLPG